MSGGGSPPPPPAQQTVSQTSEFPEELKPYISDILERSKTRAEARTAAGYQEYPAPRLAEFTPEQQQAQEGLIQQSMSGIAGTPLASSRTYLAPALGATYQSQQQFTPQAAQQYMSPYIQSVIDVQKREAERQGDRQMQQIGAGAVGAGAYGGSRQAILEAEQMRNEAQLMNDIQARGMQSAYETGLGAFERQRGRDLAAGAQFAGLGMQAPQQAVQELSGLASVGAQRQQQQQRALDIGYQQFLEEQQYPERVLQEYSSIVRGFPLTPNQFGVTQTATPAPNTMTQMAGMLGAGAGLYGAFKKKGGKVVHRNIGGLTSLVPEDQRVGTRDAYNARTAQMQEELAQARKLINDSIDARKELTKSQKEELKRDKFLELAKASFNVMGLGGQGKGLMEAVGIAGAPAIEGLRAIRGEERKLESEASGIELDAALKNLGLSEKEINLMSNSEKLRIMEEDSKRDAEARRLAAAASMAKANKRTGTGVATKQEEEQFNKIKESFVKRITANPGRYLPVMSSLNGAIQTKDDLENAINAIPKEVLNAEVKNIIKNDNVDANTALAIGIQKLLPTVRKEEGAFFDSWKY